MQRRDIERRFPSETVAHDGHRRLGKENVMALVHPGKPRAISFERGARVSKPMHPAIGLLCGFGILVAVATIVHLIFDLIF